MIWIEIIGPSGVGKSYWYEKFMKNHPEFEPKQLVLERIYTSEDFVSFSLKTKCMFWIQRMNLYRVSNHFKHLLFSYFYKGFQRKSKTIFTAEDDIIIKKYLESIDSLNEPQIVILKKICYFNQKLTEFKFYQFYLKKDDVYIAEDGLMHLSPVFIPGLQADHILIFEKEYPTLLKQRLQRAKTKPTTFIEYLLNEDDLKNYVQDYYQQYAEKINDISQCIDLEKIKTIHLDHEDVLLKMDEWISTAKTNSSRT